MHARGLPRVHLVELMDYSLVEVQSGHVSRLRIDFLHKAHVSGLGLHSSRPDEPLFTRGLADVLRRAESICL